MAITYNKDKRSGLTYAYETTCVWDNRYLVDHGSYTSMQPLHSLIVSIDSKRYHSAISVMHLPFRKLIPVITL